MAITTMARSGSVMLPLLLACAAVSPATSLSSPPIGSRGVVGVGGRCGAPPVMGRVRRRNGTRSPSGGLTASTSLQMALGGNYLDDIDSNSDNNSRGNSNQGSKSFRDNDGSWGGGKGGSSPFFGSGVSQRAASRGNNRDGGSNSGGRGGAGTAVRPPSPPGPNSSIRNGGGGSDGYGIGGNNGGRINGNNNGGGSVGAAKVFSIKQPQDLLDFVVQDERLSVVKVYASWCKTCQVFDVRYRKLASQLGDKLDGGGRLASPGRVRFAEMQFDDPNNEEMCRLLNATKLPYILMYKGSKGKVADFQCGPAKFQLLIDAVNEFADPEGSVVDVRPAAAAGYGALEGEQEWRVVREQQQKRNQQIRQEQRDAQYGGAGSITNYPPSSDADKLRRKEEEISRLYSELSTLRTDFDRRIVQLKEEHKKEVGVLNERIRAQTEEYEEQRRALTDQIQDLRREMMEREKMIRENESASSQRLRDDMKRKEEDYKKTLSGLNLQITELQRELFQSRNELQYNSNANSNDQRQLTEHIADLEKEISDLTAKNDELEKELIEEKRVVVASTEEASRVLKQLERIKQSEDEERRALVARITELESEIADREKQMMNVASTNTDLAAEIQRELDRMKKERDQERDLFKTRIADLEQELEWRTKTSTDNDATFNEMTQQLQELRQESERLASRTLELENEIEERDKLLRTSNKAADILLDNMEAQKRDYEKELDRATYLVNELEEAITSREEEMLALQERFDSLERMAEEMKRREDEREEEAAAQAASAVSNPASFKFADALRMSERLAQQQQASGMDMGGPQSLEMEREARMAAENEVGKLMGFLKEREAEIARMRQQGTGQAAPKSPFSFGAIFGGGFGPNAEAQQDESMDDYEMLKDVLMPDEVSPRGPSMPRSGAGRSDNIREGAPPGFGQRENIWEGAGQSSSSASSGSYSGAGRSDNVWGGAGRSDNIWGGATPSPAAPAEAPAGLPTPAMAFERRLAENPIVPAGAFGGSKPTASFFNRSQQFSESASAPSGVPDYYQGVIDNFNNDRRSNFGNESPAMPPASSYAQRPTSPSPRAPATAGFTENIYAGAGSASAYPSPTAAQREEPIAPVPTPAMAFERRIAENPIVPAGAFGGSQPTAHFFSPKPAPASSAPGAGEYSSPQSSFPPEDDSQSKWQRLDESEKKRVAEEAYKAFEKSLESSRRNTQTKPRGGNMNRDVAERTGGGGGGSDRVNKRPTTADAKNQSQMELERKKHQDMVNAAAAKEKENAAAPKATTANAPKTKSSQQQQSAQQVQANAVMASAKRMSLAERAAKADQDRKERERRMKAEARKAQDVRRASVQDAKDARRAETLKSVQDAKKAEEARRLEEMKRVEELKRKADADLAAATEAKAKAKAEAAKQAQERERKLKAESSASSVNTGQIAVTAKQESPDRLRVGTESLEAADRIDAALLGADDLDDSGKASRDRGEQQTDGDAKSPQKKARVAGGFAVSKYDVVLMKDRRTDIDMPRILEGSLKDLLKDDPPPKRRGASGDNY